jgi:small subunit ribosomal protein S17
MGKQKEFTGTVVSTKMQKTIIVKVMRLAKSAKYGRIVRKAVKFKVHDEKQAAKAGDTVRIRETRPLSKDKHFLLAEVVKKSGAPEIAIKEEV